MSDAIQGLAVFTVALAPTIVIVGAVARGRLSRLAAAAGLVLYGLLVLVLEHGYFGATAFRRSSLLRHEGFHLQMLAVYGLVAVVLIGFVVTRLVRLGSALGWMALLAVVVVGVGGEIATALIDVPHGDPSRYWIAGWFLWGYPVAWIAALVLAYRPTFGGHQEA